MVVDHSQRMAGRAVAERHVAFEVHLPEQVGRLHFEPLIGLARLAGGRIDPPMTAQNRMNRRDRGRGMPLPRKAACDLADAPGRMSIAHSQRQSLDCGSSWASARSTGAILEVRVARYMPSQPFVANVRTDPKPPAKLATVHPILKRKSHEFTTLIQSRHLAPRHRPPLQKEPSPAMMMCQLCPRTPVSHVSGLNSSEAIQGNAGRPTAPGSPPRFAPRDDVGDLSEDDGDVPRP